MINIPEQTTNKDTEELLISHCRSYPGLQMQDLFKFLYQSSFGCEHLVSSAEEAARHIAQEYDRIGHDSLDDIEALDGDYSRVPLTYMDRGLSADTFGKLFAMSAKKEESGMADLVNKLSCLETLVKEGRLPFSMDDYCRSVSRWKEDGYPAIHHSDAYRELYHPAYRVTANKFIPFLPIFARIESEIARSGKLIVAIEGGSASGKTTLGGLLENIYDCTLFHMDDFFLQQEQRTPERLAEAGGNVDRERFLAEVLQPLSAGEKVKYRKFDCSAMALGDEMIVEPKNLVIIEGAYSMHPDMEKYYDLSFFLDITEDEQQRRINKRNSPEMAKRFFKEWIPMEIRYFKETDVKERCTQVCPLYEGKHN